MRVLVAYDGGEAGERALAAMANWAKETAPELHLLTVLHPNSIRETAAPGESYALTPAGTSAGQLLHADPPLPMVAENRSQAFASARAVAEAQLRDVANRHFSGLDVVFHAEIAEATAEAIISFASKIGAQLIAVGTHSRTGISHALLGSVAERVVRQSPLPVLVVGPHVQAA